MVFSKLQIAALVAIVARASAQSAVLKGTSKQRGLKGRKQRVLKKDGEENLKECKNYVFHEFMEGGTEGYVFTKGPFSVYAHCDTPNCEPNTQNCGPKGTYVALELAIYDEKNDLLVFGESLDGPVTGGGTNIVDHVLPMDTVSTMPWFKQDHVGTTDYSFKNSPNHGSIMVTTDKGKFSYISASSSSIIGIHEDDYDLRDHIPGVDCIVAGTVCIVTDEQSKDDEVADLKGKGEKV